MNIKNTSFHPACAVNFPNSLTGTGSNFPPEKVIRKATQDGLHETMWEKLDLKYDNYNLVSNERFKTYLDTLEHNKMHRREKKKIVRDKIKSSFGCNNNSHSSSIIIPNKARKEVKKTSQGEAITC